MNGDAIISVADSLAAKLPPRDAIRIISQILRGVFDIDRLSLAIYDHSRDDFDIAVVEVDTSSKYGPGIRLPRRDTRIGDAFTSMQPRVGSDLRCDKRFKEDSYLAAEGMRTGLSVPLICNGKGVGTLNIDWRKRSAVNTARIATFVALAGALARTESLSGLAQNFALHSGGSGQPDIDLVLQRPSLRKHAPVLKRYALSGAPVLLTGESGSGKNILANALQQWSNRSQRPFVRIACGALTLDLLDPFRRGRNAAGSVAIAPGGSILLDEIGSLPATSQAALLGFLDAQEIARTQGPASGGADVRIIATTQHDLAEEASQKRFRLDLFQRLGVLQFELPPLRQCMEDLPVLAQFFANRIALRMNMLPPRIGARALRTLRSHSWPGNIRELSHVIERALLSSEGPELHVADAFLQPCACGGKRSAPGQPQTLAELESAHITSVLQARNWRISGRGGAAEALALHPNTLRSRMQKLGIKRPASCASASA